jgi:hypothetical protein
VKTGFAVAFGFVLLVGSSPLRADSTIRRGIDTFTTQDDGKTYYSFAQNPIPAGFFCKGSAAFTGRITFRGLALAAAGNLHGKDTILERLDDAAFDANGRATTRVRFRALSLVSSQPIRTSCGDFHAYVSLAGEQRPTAMQIYRTNERGGEFVAPLAINARISFIPVKTGKSSRGSRKLELQANVTFPAAALPWSFQPGARASKVGPVVVDTNGDLKPDTRLAGNTNFAPGWTPDQLVHRAGICVWCEPPSCHADENDQHCTSGVKVCGEEQCP